MFPNILIRQVNVKFFPDIVLTLYFGFAESKFCDSSVYYTDIKLTLSWDFFLIVKLVPKRRNLGRVQPGNPKTIEVSLAITMDVG